jgi:hypothetical protein
MVGGRWRAVDDGGRPIALLAPLAPKEGESRARLFTEFIRMLAGGGDPLDGEVFAAVWEALRIALRAELRRRGLWSSPPSYLGIYGWCSWEQVGEASGGGGPAMARAAERADALEDLAAGCYTFIFVDRFRSLAAQLRIKPDVEGLVQLGIRHFLHEQQRKHDPLGYRIFAVTRAAVRAALGRGELTVIGGDPRVRNDTILAFTAAGSAGAATPAVVPRVEVQALAQSWNDELLPDLVTAPGRALEEVAERLSHCLSDLRRHGIRRFRFKDLIDPLKRDVRSRWAALLLQDGTLAAGRDAGSSSELAAERPDRDLERQASFASLTRGVAAAVGRLETDARTRDYLARLWEFLSARAARDDESAGGANPAHPADQAADPGRGDAMGEAALSHRKVARLLGIPRERLPDLYLTLGLLVQECRAGGTDAASGR